MDLCLGFLVSGLDGRAKQEDKAGRVGTSSPEQIIKEVWVLTDLGVVMNFSSK